MATNEWFEELMDLEDLCKIERAVAAMGATLDSRWNGLQHLKKAKARLYDLIGNLSAEELKAYGEYRKTHAAH